MISPGFRVIFSKMLETNPTPSFPPKQPGGEIKKTGEINQLLGGGFNPI